MQSTANRIARGFVAKVCQIVVKIAAFQGIRADA